MENAYCLFATGPARFVYLIIRNNFNNYKLKYYNSIIFLKGKGSKRVF